MNFSDYFLLEETYNKAESDRKKARKECELNPSEEQIKSGNYKKGHFSWNGLEITIENPKGSIRKGKDKSGKAWSIQMKSDYGYFKKTESEADGDHVDVFIADDLSSQLIFVVEKSI